MCDGNVTHYLGYEKLKFLAHEASRGAMGIGLHNTKRLAFIDCHKHIGVWTQSDGRDIFSILERKRMRFVAIDASSYIPTRVRVIG
jgi:hypothetical protein